MWKDKRTDPNVTGISKKTFETTILSWTGKLERRVIMCETYRDSGKVLESKAIAVLEPSRKGFWKTLRKAVCVLSPEDQLEIVETPTRLIVQSASETVDKADTTREELKRYGIEI